MALSGFGLLQASVDHGYDYLGFTPAWWGAGWILILLGVGWVLWPLLDRVRRRLGPEGPVGRPRKQPRRRLAVGTVLVAGTALVWVGAGAVADGVGPTLPHTPPGVCPVNGLCVEVDSWASSAWGVAAAVTGAWGWAWLVQATFWEGRIGREGR